MSEIDPRKKLLFSQIRPIFQISEVIKSFFSDQTLDDFLNTTQVNAIKILYDAESKTLEVSPVRPDGKGQTDGSSSSGLEVYITKVRDEEVNIEEIQQQLILSTINSNPLLTLLNQLKNVYLPTLESEKWADQVDNNIKRLLGDLKAGLDNTLSKGSTLTMGQVYLVI